MALEKVEKIDLIQIDEDGAIHVRDATIIEEDGVELSRTYHRRVRVPDEDVTAEVQQVKDIADVVWTQEVKDAWAAKIAA